MTRARNTADTQTASGGPVPPFIAGKNKIINGDFGVWQRGTSFTNPAAAAYTADRFSIDYNTGTVNCVVSQQAFSPGTAPVSGYEYSYFLRVAQSTATASKFIYVGQKIEDVRTFAGQTVTFSFWAKANATKTLKSRSVQVFGSGGSGAVTTSETSNTITTSWARYTNTITVASISGKTIGTGSYILFDLNWDSNAIQDIDLWGFQVEAGSVATPFQTATGTTQGELAACQRYYWRNSADTAFAYVGNAANAWSTTEADLTIQNPVPMRVPAASVEYSTLILSTRAGGTTYTVTSATLASTAQSKMMTQIRFGVASGLTATVRYDILANNSTSAYLAISAEL